MGHVGKYQWISNIPLIQWPCWVKIFQWLKYWAFVSSGNGLVPTSDTFSDHPISVSLNIWFKQIMQDHPWSWNPWNHFQYYWPFVWEALSCGLVSQTARYANLSVVIHQRGFIALKTHQSQRQCNYGFNLIDKMSKHLFCDRWMVILVTENCAEWHEFWQTNLIYALTILPIQVSCRLRFKLRKL